MTAPWPRRALVIAALVLAVLALATLLARRLAAPSSGAPCFDADVLTPLADPTLVARQRQLLLRQSGQREKAFFVELYRAGVRFDDCQRGSAEPLDKQLVDSGQGRLHTVRIDQDRVVLEYVRGSPGGASAIDGIAVRITP